MSESDNVRAQKKKEISKKMKSKNFRTQSMLESDNVRAPKKWNLQKIKSQKKNEISKKKWNLEKMKSQKKWNQKISEYNQCQCQIISESG